MTDSRTYEPPRQKIQLERFQNRGLIIDIGGGGEGLVSRIEGPRVCAVDIQMDEVREARIHDPPSNWLVCDGRQLCFHNSTFDVATLWFSLGYMKDRETKFAVLKESYRVLGHGGTISIKGMKIDCEENRLVFRVDYTMPDGTLSRTGYGVKGQQNQTLVSILEIVQKVGFHSIQSRDYGHWFSIEGRKLLN